MIKLTKSDIDKKQFYLNHTNIIEMESMVDGKTKIRMINDKIVNVLENVEEIVSKIKYFEEEVKCPR